MRPIRALALVMALAGGVPLGLAGARASEEQVQPSMLIWKLDQVVFATPKDPAVLDQFTPDHSMAAVIDRLNRLGIKFERGKGSVDESLIPRATADRIKKLPAGEPFIVANPDGRVVINVVIGADRSDDAHAADTPAATAPIAEIWTVDTISFEVPADLSPLERFDGDLSMAAVLSHLERLGIKYERKQRNLDTSTVPRSTIEQILAFAPTEPWFVPNGSSITANVIVSRKPVSQ